MSTLNELEVNLANLSFDEIYDHISTLSFDELHRIVFDEKTEESNVSSVIYTRLVHLYVSDVVNEDIYMKLENLLKLKSKFQFHRCITGLYWYSFINEYMNMDNFETLYSAFNCDSCYDKYGRTCIIYLIIFGHEDIIYDAELLQNSLLDKKDIYGKSFVDYICERLENGDYDSDYDEDEVSNLEHLVCDISGYARLRYKSLSIFEWLIRTRNIRVLSLFGGSFYDDSDDEMDEFGDYIPRKPLQSSLPVLSAGFDINEYTDVFIHINFNVYNKLVRNNTHLNLTYDYESAIEEFLIEIVKKHGFEVISEYNLRLIGNKYYKDISCSPVFGVDMVQKFLNKGPLFFYIITNCDDALLKIKDTTLIYHFIKNFDLFTTEHDRLRVMLLDHRVKLETYVSNSLTLFELIITLDDSAVINFVINTFNIMGIKFQLPYSEAGNIIHRSVNVTNLRNFIAMEGSFREEQYYELNKMATILSFIS